QPDGPGWQSGHWFFRREHLFLLPGDSPMGFRLPLDSLPWESEEDRQQLHEVDPFAPREPLQGRFQFHLPGREPSGPSPVVRTALCVEPREGRLHVFMPPVEDAEDYLTLAAAVEATAADLRTPVLLEGYAPPFDPRLDHFHVTPDPGVIEVNVHPAHGWDELARNTTTLYEEAHQARLSTEKFMLDGRHTGTGGGNHVIL